MARRKAGLTKLIEQGEMSAEDFLVDVACKQAFRTHCMQAKGARNYVLLQYPFGIDRITIEEVAEFNFPEKGDFTTTRGTIGPTEGNVFISVNPDSYPKNRLVIGDNVRPGSGSVCDAIREYKRSA